MKSILAMLPKGAIYSPTRIRHYVCYDSLSDWQADQFKKIENTKAKG